MRTPATLAIWRQGLGRLRGFQRPLLLAWMLSLALALPAALPIHDALDQAMSQSRFGETAARGFDLDWFMDFRSSRGDAFAAANPALLVSAALTLLLSVFLAGGVLGRLRALPPEGTPAPSVRVADFLSDSARYFPRFLRVFLLTAIGYALVFWLLRIQLSEWLELRMTWWPSHAGVLVARVVLSAAVLWLMAWLHMVQDLARLGVVVHDRRSTARALAAGLGESWRHFEELAGIYLVGLFAWLVVGALHLLLAWAAGRLPGAASWMGVLLVAQLTVLARTWFGFGLTSSLLVWYRERLSKQATPVQAYGPRAGGALDPLC